MTDEIMNLRALVFPSSWTSTDSREGADGGDPGRLRPGHLDPLRVDSLVKAMGMSGTSKSQVRRLCEEIDQRVKAFLDRPIEGEYWPYFASTPPT